MAQHHALGTAGGAGRVLDHRQRRGVRIMFGPPVAGAVGDRVGRDPAHRCVPSVDRLHEGDGGGGAEHHRCTGVDGKRVEAVERSRPGRVRGHGDAAGVECTEEAGDEFEAGRVGKHDVAAGKPHVLEVRGDRPGAPIQLCVGQRRLRRFAFDSLRECDIRGRPAASSRRQWTRLVRLPCASLRALGEARSAACVASPCSRTSAASGLRKPVTSSAAEGVPAPPTEWRPRFLAVLTGSGSVSWGADPGRISSVIADGTGLLADGNSMDLADGHTHAQPLDDRQQSLAGTAPMVCAMPNIRRAAREGKCR